MVTFTPGNNKESNANQYAEPNECLVEQKWLARGLVELVMQTDASTLLIYVIHSFTSNTTNTTEKKNW